MNDNDKQIEELTNELVFTSNYGTYNAVANYLVNKGYRKQNEREWVPSADVVPKSEVEKLTIELLHTKEDYGDLFATLVRAKTEVASKIFEEINRLVNKLLNEKEYSIGDFCWDYEQLKQKLLQDN